LAISLEGRGDSFPDSFRERRRVGEWLIDHVAQAGPRKGGEHPIDMWTGKKVEGDRGSATV